MNSKSLLILDKSKATIENDRYIFRFSTGIKLIKWKLRKFYTNNIEMSKLYCHIPELTRKTQSATLDGEGNPSDIIALVSDGKANDDNDRNTMFLNTPHKFHKLTVYFTNGEDNTAVALNDFSVCLDIIRPN